MQLLRATNTRKCKIVRSNLKSTKDEEKKEKGILRTS